MTHNTNVTRGNEFQSIQKRKEGQRWFRCPYKCFLDGFIIQASILDTNLTCPLWNNMVGLNIISSVKAWHYEQIVMD